MRVVVKQIVRDSVVEVDSFCSKTDTDILSCARAGEDIRTVQGEYTVVGVERNTKEHTVVLTCRKKRGLML